MFASHHPVERFHQQLLLPPEEIGQFPPHGVEVLGVGKPAFHRQGLAKFPELQIEAVLVGQEVFKSAGTCFGQGLGNEFRQALGVVGVADTVIPYLVPCRRKGVGKSAHGGEKGHDLLDVVPGVVGFLAHFCHEVADIRAHLRKPGVPGVELVTEDEAERFHREGPVSNRVGWSQRRRKRPSASYRAAWASGLKVRSRGSLPTPLLYIQLPQLLCTS